LKKSAEEIAAEIEKRHEYQRQMKQQIEDDHDGILGGSSAFLTPVAQQSLLPTYKDPKLFKIKCRPSMEQLAIRAIMLKTIDLFNRNSNDFYRIKSAFCGTSKGYIYIEAISETFAKEVLNGLKMIYHSSFQQVPIQDMTSVLAVTITKKPLRIGQYIRIKRGPLKGDLARIINIFDGETKVCAVLLFLFIFSFFLTFLTFLTFLAFLTFLSLLSRF
jgi:transcription elongation factor SPT5